MAQFSVAIALLSGLSLSGLGAGLSLLQSDDFARRVDYQITFFLAMLSFVVTATLCLASTISRALDFRLTARKVRGHSDLTFFGLNDRQFGRISWCLFWVAVLSFSFGILLFVVSVGIFLVQKLLCGFDFR